MNVGSADVSQRTDRECGRFAKTAAVIRTSIAKTKAARLKAAPRPSQIVASRTVGARISAVRRPRNCQDA